MYSLYYHTHRSFTTVLSAASGSTKFNRVVSVNACNLGILEASACEAVGTWSKPTDLSIGDPKMTGVQWSYLKMHPLMVHSKTAELASLFFGGSSISDIHQEHIELITCWVKSKELVHFEEDYYSRTLQNQQEQDEEDSRSCRFCPLWKT